MQTVHSRSVRRIAPCLLMASLVVFSSARAGAEEQHPSERNEGGPRGLAVTAQFAHAPNADAFGEGEGIRLGYAIPLGSELALELGASAVTYAGTNTTTPGTPVTVNPSAPSPTSMDSISVLLYGADLGLHIRFGALSLKPYVSGGLGWLTGRSCVGSACVTTANDQHPFVAPGASLQLTAARHYIVGLDFRYVFMPVSGQNVTTQAYAAFAGYQF